MLQNGESHFLTIFTPCYNRAKCLPRLYQSLQDQVCDQFEWIAIDDGSTDNTFEILREYQNNTSKFNIYVYAQENGGKHRAINEAVKIAHGKYFFILDSDDYLTKDAVKKVHEWCRDIENLSDYDSYAGVAGLKMAPNHSIVGGHGRGEKYIDATNLQRNHFKLNGDKAEIYKTDLLKKHPFREFEGENFLSEDTVWNAIAEQGYLIRWHMEPIYICEYRNDGLTKNLSSNQLDNFEGYTFTTKEHIRLLPIKGKAGAIGRYAIQARKKGLSGKEISMHLEIPYTIFCVVDLIYSVLKTSNN